MKFSKYFLLTGENIIIILIAEVLAIIFHNITSALFRTEESLFFIMAVIIPLYFIISLIYTIYYLSLKKGKARERKAGKIKYKKKIS